MTFKKFMIAAGMVAMTAMPAAAGEIITDNYIGYGKDYNHGYNRDVIGNSNYDVYSMVVSRSDAGIMTVRINTKFVDINYTGNNGNYVYGDLLMSVKNGSDLAAWEPNISPSLRNDDFQTTGTTWEYAYDINGARYDTGSFTDNNSARLVSIDNPKDSNSFDYGSARYDGNSKNDHIYRVASGTTTLNANKTHQVIANTASNYLEFVFDVTGTSLMTAEQIAFHWTMSCANDVIEGVANFTNNVPEPAALGLLFLGLGGVAFARRRKNSLSPKIA